MVPSYSTCVFHLKTPHSVDSLSLILLSPTQPVTHVRTHTHAHTNTHSSLGEGREGCEGLSSGWELGLSYLLLPLASIIHVNTLAAEVGWISWIQGNCSKINKMKQCNLEFVGNM